MQGSGEVSATNSHAVMAAEIADGRRDYEDLKRTLLTFLVVAKETAAFLPAPHRMALLDAIVTAENEAIFPRRPR